MKRLCASIIMSLFAVTFAYAQMGAQGDDVTAKQKGINYCNAEANKLKIAKAKRKDWTTSCQAKVGPCANQADDKKLKGVDYINFIGKCVQS
jgi:hypothetical protein